jgi:tRNA pseudouridine38-40 synthase
MLTLQNYRATVEYDGTNYGGFQIQSNRVTIQGELERALESVTQEFVRVYGAGRTDAGVHARGQVVNFRTGWSHGREDLQRALNALLPLDISVRDVAEVEQGFHARYSASSRVYAYTLYSARVRSPLLDRWMYHVAQHVDAYAMIAASDSLVGEHDFSAFGQPPVGDNTVRCVHRIDWRSQGIPFCDGPSPGLARIWQFEIEGNAFLRGMVRRIVGTLVSVGTGVLSVQEFRDILVSCDIRRAGMPAPACGLCLWAVWYGPRALGESKQQEADLANSVGAS